MMKFIDKVGIELEGGWKKPFPDEDPTEIYADHSVHLGGYPHTGECASPPLEAEEAIKWMVEHYPQGMDASCGIHVHISTKRDEDYALLASTPHFFMNFLLWGKEIHKGLPGDEEGSFYERLSGRNRFCALKFIPSRQLPLKRKTTGNDVQRNPRYAMLNFCKGIHNTMENRVFPVFLSKEVAERVIKSYVDMTEAFIKNASGKMKEMKVVRGRV